MRKVELHRVQFIEHRMYRVQSIEYTEYIVQYIEYIEEIENTDLGTIILANTLL